MVGFRFPVGVYDQVVICEVMMTLDTFFLLVVIPSKSHQLHFKKNNIGKGIYLKELLNAYICLFQSRMKKSQYSLNICN